MTEKEKMLKKLRELWDHDPALFDEIVREYKKRGPEIFPNDEPHPRQRTGRRTNRTPDALALIYAKVEFLRWRDGKTIAEACNALLRHDEQTDDKITQYDTTDNRWRVGEEGKPPTFDYRPKWNRQDYYDAKKLVDEGEVMGEIWLEEMKAAYEGDDSSMFDTDFLKRAFPPEPES